MAAPLTINNYQLKINNFGSLRSGFVMLRVVLKSMFANFILIYRQRFGTCRNPSPTDIEETFVFSRRDTACRVRSCNQTLPIKPYL